MRKPFHILYLHGFRSSPASTKVRIFADWLAGACPHLRLIVPALRPSPAESVAQAVSLLQDARHRWAGIVGSSLGGYYAAHLAARFPLPAALINPAVHPYRLFESYVGEHVNLHTGEVFELKPCYLDELRALEVDPHPRQEHLLVLLQAGDQTLDYREALCKYPRSPAWVMPAGSHEFEGFERVLPAIAAFLSQGEVVASEACASSPVGVATL